MTRTTAKHRGDAQRGNLNATPRRRWLGIGLVMLATLCWSTAGITITTFVRETNIEAFGLAFWRVLFSFLVLFIGMLIFKPRALRIHRRDIPWLAGMGVFAVGAFQVFWILAILNNGASIATVIQCNAPIIVTLLAWVFWREPLTWRKWAAIGLATIGTILAAGVIGAVDLQITPIGLFFSLGSAATYAAFTLFTKKLTGDYNPFVILMMAFGFATLALLPFQIGRPLPTGISGLAVLAFVGLVLITTIAGYVLYTTALRHLQASVAAILAMSEVPFASFFGYVVLGERLGPWQIIGALAVVSGVALLSLRPARRDAA